MTDLPDINSEIPLDSAKYRVFEYIPMSYVDELLDEFLFLDSSGSMQDGLQTIKGSRNPERKEILNSLKRNKQHDLQNNGADFWANINCQPWIDFVAQRGNSTPRFSKCEVGDFYKCHFDNPQNGHFSNTLFLSHPDEYEGGELEILVDGEVVSFKLQPGQIVTYETGLAHQVKPVTKGTRKVVLWWTHSMIPNLTDLYAWRTLIRLVHESRSETGDFYPRDLDDITDDLHEFVRKPHCIYNQAANNIIRKHLYTFTGNTL